MGHLTVLVVVFNSVTQSVAYVSLTRLSGMTTRLLFDLRPIVAALPRIVLLKERPAAIRGASS